jgi:hypothetical protein
MKSIAVAVEAPAPMATAKLLTQLASVEEDRSSDGVETASAVLRERLRVGQLFGMVVLPCFEQV